MKRKRSYFKNCGGLQQMSVSTIPILAASATIYIFFKQVIEATPPYFSSLVVVLFLRLAVFIPIKKQR